MLHPTTRTLAQPYTLQLYYHWKQTILKLTTEWIKKIWYIYIMEYYSAVKNNNIIFAGKWMELEKKKSF